MLNKKLTERDGLAISIGKPRISFDQGRLEGNRELIGSLFCDSNGIVYKLIDIEITGKDKNLIRAMLYNNFKYPEWGEYKFRPTNEHYNLEEFKEIAKELMRLETSEDAQEEYCEHIEQSDSFEAVIDNFIFGRQE
ncbi:hypothetical protein K6119_10695 [Paracrocinitomix mangrovi]|uniref:hypothetical protein n=1 Tax=Paracrocinitomix mangrovi TaxID=2862509 RepID=UPI001C8E4BB1|nr:hypothetical protein [Paracrocinitomix mangrovi]UKN00200.1 hypothetical protein K6119_10695 [Paracrocinitomix mangrovi]